MKPHVRYGHTPHTTAGGGIGAAGSAAAGRSHQLYRRPGRGDDDDCSMIEEYKLEEQLAPFYETTSSSLSERSERTSSAQQQSVRCFLPPAQSPGKPALRTVSIMETLSELTSSQSARGADGGGGSSATGRIRRPPEEASSSSPAGGAQQQAKPHPGSSSGQQSIGIQRRMKKGDNNGNAMAAMAGILDISQWYPTKGRVASGRADAGIVGGSSERVWDVSHFGIGKSSTNKHQGNSDNLTAHRSKARSVQDMLFLHSPSKSIQSHKNNTTSSACTEVASSATSAHGYGSLERRRRRRPGARAGAAGFAVPARRGETDWEREADEEDDDDENFRVYGGGLVGDGGRRGTEPIYPMQSALFRQHLSKGRNIKNESVAEVTHQNYKPAAEWFKEKRPPPSSSHPNRIGKVGGGASDQQQLLINKERGQTPEWIHKIFDVARRGHLIKLQRVMTGMEPTLVRNLSDHRGNNLLHVLAGSGNADALAWLCSSFGVEMQDALLDENKRGLTPVVAAIQAGRLEALQFLVDHTSARDRLAPVDGDRCLLHIAAKYGKIDLVAWLAQYMESHGFEVDLRDHCGQTPLHLAARAGHASAVAILVAHGADVTAKNDMGHRPLDLASANGHVGVAQLLRLHDAALCLSSETLEANEELDNLRGDYAELKSYFRDVLVIGKRFAKERDEMCRQLGRLYEDVTSLHQALLFELRTLHRDLAGVRDRVSSSRKAGEIADRNLDESVAVVEALHDKWQSQQRSWFSSNLADMEHRLLMAEDGWKRLRTSTTTKHRTCQIRPHELLRSRLAAVNAQASNIQCDVTAPSSDEGSLYSGCCPSVGASSDGEDGDVLASVESANGNYNNSGHFSPPAINNVAASRIGESVAGSTAANTSSTTTGPPTWYKSPRSLAVAFKTRQAASGHARNGTPAADSTSGTDGVYGTVNAAVRKVAHNPEQERGMTEQLERNYHRRKATPSSARQELRKRLQEVKLTSESGNASVIEVIEPSSSEADDHDDVLDGRTPRDQSTPLRGSNTRSFNASFSEELERARQSKRMHNNPLVTNESTAAGTPVTASANANAKTLAEPDLLAGTVPVMAGSSRSCHDLSLVQRLVDQQQLVDHQLASGDDVETIATGNSTRSHSSLSSSNNTAVTSVSVPAAAGSRKKSGGFLTKFALKARWPSKRSSKSSSAESPSLLTPATSPVACDSSPTTAETESGPSDFSLGDSTTSPQLVHHHHHHRQCEEEEESTAGPSAGVVAGLSQMFEDMSMSGIVKSPTKPNAQVAQLTVASLEKRGSHSLAGPESLDGSRCKSAASTATESANQQVVMDLPPSTSPPPVPLEIETYNSMSPSSQNETSSSSVCSSGGTNGVGGMPSMQPPPPPPRFSTNSKGSSDLSSSSSKVSNTSGGGVGGGVGVGGATPGSSSASSSTSASHGGAESLSVAASEDSGIVMARPASSASKSDSSPRHPPTPSSSYTFTNTSTFSPLRKATLTGSGSTSSSATHQSIQSQSDAEQQRHGLLSPAPSNCVSKAESTASGDLLLSKTESMRHFRQLARIEEQAASATGGVVVTGQMVVDGHPDRVEHMSPPQASQDGNVEMAHQSGQILTWREAKLKNQVVTPPPLEERLNKARVRLEEKSIRTLKKRHPHVTERPWYDVSDDESDLLTPERLTKLKTSLSSSDSPSSDSNGSHGSSSSGDEEEV